MNSSKNFRGVAERPLAVGSLDITNHSGNGAMFGNVAALDGKRLAKIRRRSSLARR